MNIETGRMIIRDFTMTDINDMQDILGGAQQYAAAYQAKLAEVLASGEDLTLHVKPSVLKKEGDGSGISGRRVIAQKQPGLYTVLWHPIGGQPDPEQLFAVEEQNSGHKDCCDSGADQHDLHGIKPGGVETADKNSHQSPKRAG